MYYNWKKNINTEELEEVVNLIKRGEIIVFPTETVYGIGADCFNEKAVKKIFEAKGRPSDNPLIVHIADKQDIKKVAKISNELEQKLIDKFMPGPITIILKKNENLPNIVCAGLDTVGVRMPSEKIANEIIKKSQTFLAAPSANISGRPSGTQIEDIREELENKVSCIIDGGETKVGLESTVVKVEKDTVIILRPGKITPEEIQEKCNCKVIVDKKVFEEVKDNEKPQSPGMKYRHYAPNTKCKLVYSKSEEKQIEIINNFVKQNKNTVVICFEEHKKKISIEDDKKISIGSKNNFEEIAQKMYSCLRKADKKQADLILIEGVEKQGIGIAIMNRLLRTCEYDFLEG